MILFYSMSVMAVVAANFGAMIVIAYVIPSSAEDDYGSVGFL
ncbi:hypothetical protein [Bradyrhizobium sp. ARR65]|nr:hypothetical protein [Bradyrhizobium sp. ARR65]